MLQIPNEIKELLQQSSVRKNLIIEFPNGEMEKLDNSHIKSESMSFDESICSSDDLKFGLCESSVLKFTTINNVPNMKGMVIKASVGIEYKKNNSVSTKEGSSVIFNADTDFTDSSKIDIVFNGASETSVKTVYVEYKMKATYSAMVLPNPSMYETSENKITIDGYDETYHSPISKITVTTPNCIVTLTAYEDVYKIPLGLFTAHECKKQADMSVRNVVAYSNYFNFDDTEITSSYEMLKMTAGEKTSADYTFDVCRYALTSVSQNVEFDFEKMGIMGGSSSHITGQFTDNTNTKGISLGGTFGRTNFYAIDVTIKRKRLDITNSNELIGYVCGQKITPDNVIRQKFETIFNTYGNSAKKRQYDYDVADAIQNCSIIADYSTWNGVSRIYTGLVAKLSNTGIIDAKAIYHTGMMQEVFVPSEIVIKVYSYDRFGGNRTLVDESNFYLFNVDTMDFFILDFSNSDFKMPQATLTIPRAKNNVNAYVVDTNKLPNVTDVFKAMLELNGLYFVQDRSNCKYSFFNIGGIGSILFPEISLFPSELLYPSETDLILRPENYFTSWYDDEEIGNYEKIVINYTDDDDVKHNITVYDPIYDYQYGEPSNTVYISSTETSAANGYSGNKKLYFNADGLIITLVEGVNSSTSAREDLFSGNSDMVRVDIDASLYSGFYVYVDESSMAEGQNYYLNIGEYTSEEIDADRKTLDLSDNYIINNFKFDDTFISNVVRKCLDNIIDISYMPCEIDLKGLPYAQAGDSFCVTTTTGEGFVSIILSRTLSGINSLKDRYTSN